MVVCGSDKVVRLSQVPAWAGRVMQAVRASSRGDFIEYPSVQNGSVLRDWVG
jgi:hypothetical protein